MTNPSSGATSEMQHRENATSAQAGNEPEQQRMVDESGSFFGGRSRKTSDDFSTSNASSAAHSTEESAQETRPRTTTLSSMNDPEAVRAPTSHFYGPFAASGEPAAPTNDIDSEPSTPLAAERDAQPGLNREHRPAPLQLKQKFPSSNQVQVVSARQSHGITGASPLRQEHSNVQEPAKQPQSASSTPKTHRRSRSSSLPLTRERPEGKSRRRRANKNSVDWTTASSPTAAKSGSSLAAPLSQFQLLALHQLSLPRPAYLSSNSSSRLWAHAPGKRHQTGSYQSSASANLYCPSLAPPIGLATLKELDLGEILRNPQLRHDIVFDPNLVFRPNFDGTRGQKKIEASDRYWTAVEREITLGCRCTVFNEAGEALACVCPGAGLASSALDALCHRGQSSRQWGKRRSLDALPIAARLPSRIGPLVAELRAILLSLLPTPPVSPCSSSASGAPDSPGSYHLIESALDPDLIRQEVEHGVLDVGNLARFLGDTLRMHCAPMRDEMVDTMVSLIAGDNGISSGESIAQGLQMAFEILELMKLDIANHQLRTLRPYLLETALEFELRGCLDFADRAKTSAFTKTNDWVQAAAVRTSSQQTFKVVTDGLMQSVFHTEGFDAPRWDRHAANLATRHIPETLQLDLHRIRLFHSDITDLTVVYLLLMLFRSLAGSAVTEAHLDTMSHDIWVLMQSNELVRASSPLDASSMPLASSLSRVSKVETPHWREGMSDVLLQIAARADAIKSRKCDFQDLVIPGKETLAMLKGWMDTNLRPSAALFKLLQKRLRDSVEHIINTEYGPKAGSASSSWWMRSIQPSTEAPTAPLPANLNMSWGQCSRAARMLDLPVSLSSSSSSSSKSQKRRREDGNDEAIISPRKKRRVASNVDGQDTVDDADTEALLKRNGLYCLRHELQGLSDRMGKVVAFNVEVWEVLYTQLLAS